MTRQTIHTDSAPKAIGPYSQAVRAGNLVFLSGQIPLDPATMELVSGDFEAEVRRAFENLKAVVEASGGTLDQVVKLTLFLTDLAHFPKVNEVMTAFFKQPFPARSTVGVSQLPKGARFEVECVLHLG
jgi:reactive intermediate/imine deaminase